MSPRLNLEAANQYAKLEVQMFEAKSEAGPLPCLAFWMDLRKQWPVSSADNPPRTSPLPSRDPATSPMLANPEGLKTSRGEVLG